MLNRILIFAPHPDDEILGCGGFILKKIEEGSEIKIVYVTKGELFATKDENVRIKELKKVNKFLKTDFELLYYPDSNIPINGKILDDYLELYKNFLPDTIMLPSPFDPHKDHINVTRGVIKALTNNIYGPIKLMFYEIVQPSRTNHIEDITVFYNKKEELLKIYDSQLGRYKYLQNMFALNLLRGAQLGVKYGEGFLIYDWDGYEENFFPHTPLISIILRSSKYRLLIEALQSIITQIYSFYEVIIVWFGEETLKLPERFDTIDYKIIYGKRNRGYNLNIGIENSSGEYIAFLDEDDYWYNNHLIELLNVLISNKDIDLIYSSCFLRKIKYLKNETLIEEVLDKIREPYEKGRIILENYIPFISIIGKKYIFEKIKFSDDISAYEDWLFLCDVELNNFKIFHLDKVTCEYRIQENTIFESHRKRGYLKEEEKVRKIIFDKLSYKNIFDVAIFWNNKKRYIRSLKKNINLINEQLFFKDKKLKFYNELLIKKNNLSIKNNILFSILIVTYNSEPVIFYKTLESIKFQNYNNWEICIVDNNSKNIKDLEIVIEKFEKENSLKNKLKFLKLDKNFGISEGFNIAAKMANGDYLVFIDHDDWLYPDALYELASNISNKNYKFIYTDSCLIDYFGKSLAIHKKPDWSPDTILSFNYINHLTIFKKSFWEEIGGYNSEYNGAQDWEILLRIREIVKEKDIYHLKKVVYGWRALKGSTAYKMNEKNWVKENTLKLFLNYFNKKFNFNTSKVFYSKRGPGINFPVNYNYEPYLSIIILTKKNSLLLKNCITGILTNNYSKYKIIIVNTGDKTKNIESIRELSRDKIEVIHFLEPFNWSRANNFGVKNAEQGDMFLFLNDDVQILDKNFLNKIVQPFQLSNVGAVGALLKFPNGAIQHNGIKTSIDYVAYEIRTYGEYNELNVMRNVSAVTGACMLVKKEAFFDVDGFDENLPYNYNDVDFCLKLRKKEWRIIQFPLAEAIHFHMTTRGKENLPEEWEINYMKKKWDDFLDERFFYKFEKISDKEIIMEIK